MHFLRRYSFWLKNDDYKNLLKNGTSLGIVQLSNYILPLITLPYLARVLGPDYFGLVMMAQATMIYLTLLTDYGFNLSATQNGKEHSFTCFTRSGYISSITLARAFLLAAASGLKNRSILRLSQTFVFACLSAVAEETN